MKNFFLFIIFITGVLFGFKNDDPVVTTEDVNILTGSKWVGKLSYLDYSSNKDVSILSDVTVSGTDDPNVFIFINEYPKEPNANSTDTVRISDDGKIFDGETVTSRSVNSDGAIELVTETEGIDDNRPALFRHTYIISNTKYSVRKDVKFKDGNDFFKRHIYEFERNN